MLGFLANHTSHHVSKKSEIQSKKFIHTAKENLLKRKLSQSLWFQELCPLHLKINLGIKILRRALKKFRLSFNASQMN
jgi:hypothetical protein